MDVLEAGPPASSRQSSGRRSLRVAAGTGIAVLAVAIALGAVQWWTSESARPDRLEVVQLASIGPFAISGEDLPDDWPPGLVAGALRLRADVAGDPQRATRVGPAGDTGAYVASGSEGAVVEAGERSEVDVVVTPADCGGIADPASPLVDAEGAGIPLGPAAEQQLVEALASLCASGGSAASIAADSVRVDVFFRERTLVMRARVTAYGDRVVLQPRDSTGFQGGEEQEATIEDGVATARLRWLVSPAEVRALESPTVRVRVFAVTGGRAHPWVVDLRVPEGFPLPTPSAPRNDGVDLAEVAPRPSD